MTIIEFLAGLGSIIGAGLGFYWGWGHGFLWSILGVLVGGMMGNCLGVILAFVCVFLDHGKGSTIEKGQGDSPADQNEDPAKKR